MVLNATKVVETDEDRLYFIYNGYEGQIIAVNTGCGMTK